MIKEVRQKYRLTQTEAANLVGVSLRTWQRWEKKDNAKRAALELFLIKVRAK